MALISSWRSDLFWPAFSEARDLASQSAGRRAIGGFGRVFFLATRGSALAFLRMIFLGGCGPLGATPVGGAPAGEAFMLTDGSSILSRARGEFRLGERVDVWAWVRSEVEVACGRLDWVVRHAESRSTWP